MVKDTCHSILTERDFHKIGELSYRLVLDVWWHAETQIEILCIHVGSKTVVKGSKAYYLRSITEEGETWARDIPPLQDYLEAHFPELHLSFSYFRDITPTAAARQIHRRSNSQPSSSDMPGIDVLATLQQQLEDKRRVVESMDNLIDLDTGTSDLLRSYAQGQKERLRREVDLAKDRVREERERLSLFENLQREYERKGSAACLVFSISSNVHLVESPDDFSDALASIVKELRDAHRYQITQKLCAGRLNIHVAEAAEPVLIWIEQWFGGALSPRQLDKLERDLDLLCHGAADHTMITPNQDIRVGGHVKDDQKLLAARVVSTLVRRLDRPEPTGFDPDHALRESLPARLGLIMARGQTSRTTCHVPMARLNHAYVSGTTGSGKSYLGRVLVEEAVQYDDLNILVLDPRNQSAGLLVPEDRESILSLYPPFGMSIKDTRGFEFAYYAPAETFGEKLPTDLGQLGSGRAIVSFKGLDDCRRCLRFRQILDAVFERYAGQESASLRLLIVIEEAQRFTKKRVTEDAKAAGEQAENALDRTLREGRKYGCCAVIISQTIRDFAYGSASIRQNTNTKVFMHNSDREIDYAADFIGDGRRIVRLHPGTAIIYNTAWGAIEVKVRPPLSKVWEFSSEDMQRLLQPNSTPLVSLSADAEQLLATVRSYCDRHDLGLNLRQAAEALGISSKRRLQQLVDELERAHLVRTRKLQERGQPRIIEPISSGRAD